MTSFLLIYDRRGRELVSVNPRTSRADALVARVREEVAALLGGHDREIVILEAQSLEAITRSHASYFRNVRELAEDAEQAARVA